MIFGEVPVEQAAGAVLAHSIRGREAAFKKGHLLTADDVARLAEAGIERVMVAQLEPGDVPEDEAASVIAEASAGDHAKAAEPFTGRSNIHSEAAGLALVDADRVHRLNTLDESLTVATVAPFARVERRQMLATIKIIPFATRRDVVDTALAICREGPPLVRVAPFAAREAGLVMTVLPQTKPQTMDKARAAIAARLEAAGSRLAATVTCPHEVADVTRAIASLRDNGHAPILVLGASAIVDRGDVIPAALAAAGGEVVNMGMPVDPGNLLMYGELGPVPVIGVPTCARSPKVNGFDWVLWRVLAGLPVSRHDIAGMGVGGLLMEIPSRPVPREGKIAAAPKSPSVAAIVLAAGQSRRMGGINKLMEPVGGRPMIRGAVEAALASTAETVIVVVGHDADRIRGVLDGLAVTIVDNPNYAQGLSTSLRAGLGAVPAGMDGALVCLGDMPLVSARHLDKLIAAFKPEAGRGICVPVVDGKRGNPVLFATAYFDEMREVQGDTGARHLIGQHAEAVCEVEMGDRAVLTDVDTPDNLSSLRQAG